MSRPPDPASAPRPWVTAYPPGVPATYRLPAAAVPRLLDDAARDFPDTPAVVADDHEATYRQLADRVGAVAGALADLGVGPRARVLVALPNGHALPTVLLALWRLGAVAVPVVPDTTSERLRELTTEVQPLGIVGDEGSLGSLVATGELPPVAVLVSGAEWTGSRRMRRLIRRVAHPTARRQALRHGALALADLLASGPTEPQGPAPQPGDPALLTAHARIGDLDPVMLTHANLVAAAFQVRLWIPDVQAGRERLLVVDRVDEPRAITAGLLPALLSAATLVLADDPEAGALPRLVEELAPTLLMIRPERLHDLAGGDAQRRDLGSLRVCLALGGPVEPAIAAAVERRTGGMRLRETYGPTAAGVLTHAQPVYGRFEPGTVGLPLPETVAAVVSRGDLGRPAAPGEIGRLLVRGPQVPATHWGRPHRQAARCRAGWWVTEHYAVMDDDGAFRWTGRVGETLDQAGTPVSPRQVETVLRWHPDVREAALVPDGAGALRAEVVLRRRASVTPDALLAHCRAHLVASAVPTRVDAVEALSRPPATTPGR